MLVPQRYHFLKTSLLFVSIALLTTSSYAKNYHTLKTTEVYSIYCLKNTSTLTKVGNLNIGSTVKVPTQAVPQLLNLESGRRDTSGFFGDIVLNGVKKPSRCSAKSSFYMTALLPLGDSNAAIEALVPSSSLTTTYKRVYEQNSQIKMSDSTIAWAIGRNSKRFARVWNKSYPSGSLSSEEVLKSKKILRELSRFGNRENTTAARMLYLPSTSADSRQRKSLARNLSKKIMSQYGFSPAYGAWDVAIYGTATRLGFPQAPCAEFVSEVIRQAYVRAGFSHDEDFSYTIEGRLIFTPWQNGIYGPQSVKGLSDRLVIAGWIPWDPSKYQPVTGAIAMALDSSTPGHTYIVGGKKGRYIVDNGNPKGMDLGKTTLKLSRFKDMYGMGTFFLPPGITPALW
jgi:hypothetical protein